MHFRLEHGNAKIAKIGPAPRREHDFRGSSPSKNNKKSIKKTVRTRSETKPAQRRGLDPPRPPILRPSWPQKPQENVSKNNTEKQAQKERKNLHPGAAKTRAPLCARSRFPPGPPFLGIPSGNECNYRLLKPLSVNLIFDGFTLPEKEQKSIENDSK